MGERSERSRAQASAEIRGGRVPALSGYAARRLGGVRRLLALLAAGALAGSLAACGTFGPPAAETSAAPGSAAPTSGATSTVASTRHTSEAPPTGSTRPAPKTGTSTTARPTSKRATAKASPGTALAALGLLVVKGRAPMTGYDRDEFGSAWSDIDRNGCDQRNDVLRRDLVGITLKAGTHGCKVMSGTLHDPYTGMTVAFQHSSSSFSPVQIDHVVALGDAWAMGAWRWSEDERKQLANDPLDLLAVDAHYNMSKGDGDAATWLPPHKSERCPYVARQVAVKVKYHLAVTGAEQAAMKRVLSGCPSQRLPVSAAIPLGGGRTVVVSPSSPSRAPAPSTTSRAPRASSARHVVHPGAFCAPVGATGVTTKGTPMVCSVKAGQDRARWRSAG